jgi:hypothetical protein
MDGGLNKKFRLFYIENETGGKQGPFYRQLRYKFKYAYAHTQCSAQATSNVFTQVCTYR